MEPLEDILRRVEGLRQDLSALSVLKEEVGHTEFFDPHADGYCRSQDANGNCYCGPAGDVWVVDEGAITEPDISKRGAAKALLTALHASSESYTARYLSGKYLEVDDKDNLNRWVSELSNKLKSQSSPEEELLWELDDALRLVDLTSDEDIKRLLGEVYETATYKSVRVKAGVETLKRDRYDWQPYRYKWKEYPYPLIPDVQAKVYAHELSLGSKLEPAELETLFYHGPTRADREKAGMLLNLDKADILGVELDYPFREYQKLPKEQLELVYKSATVRRFREEAATALGFSKAKFLEDEADRGYPLSEAYAETWAKGRDILDIFYKGTNPKYVREAGRLFHMREPFVLGRLMEIGQQLTRDELMSVYESSGSAEYMSEAGRRLGFSSARIWLHTHIKKGIGI